MLEDFKNSFLKHFAVLNYSAETIKTTRHKLKPFLVYLHDHGIQTPGEITAELVRQYPAHLFEQVNAKGQKNAVPYRNKLVLAAKGFLRFLFDEKQLGQDLADQLELSIEPKRLPRTILTQAEMRKLLDAPDKTTALGYRDRTILEVFYSCGIRRNELIHLRLLDVDLDAQTLRINSGKWNKDRVVPLGKIACRYLGHYIKEVRPYFVKDHSENYLFLSREGNSISKCMIGLRLKEYAKQAGIDKDITPHTLRATCATHCIQGKKRKEQMHPRYLMELLGHSSMESLNPYLSVSIVELKEAHARCHPREREAS